MKNFKINKPALISGSILSALMLLFFLLFGFSFLKENLWFVIGILVYISLVHYFLFLYGINKSIYKNLKKIYKKIKIVETKNTSLETVENIEKKVEHWNTSQEKEIKELKERELFRREFIGNVSHELKTPIFTIQGYLLTVLDGALQDDIELSEKYIKRANKGVERMIHIVKDLEKITNLEAGVINMDLGKYDVIQIAKDSLENIEQKIQKKNITVSFTQQYPQKQFVKCDRKRIEQVFTNLFVNSVKYGNENGIIEIDVREKSGKVIITVRDNGNGIDEKHLPRLFERFYRVEKSRTRSNNTAGGSGLGLAIVKHILDAHKQKITVESELGIGTAFTFTLDK